MRFATRPFFVSAASHPDVAVPMLAAIPASFDLEQAGRIRELRRLHERTPAGAALLLVAWTPARFSPAQAECIGQLLALDARDFAATLADAVHPVAMRRPALIAQVQDRAGQVALRSVDPHFHFDPHA